MSMKETIAQAYPVMKEQFGYKNLLAAPRVQKVVLNIGTGSGMKRDKTRNAHVIDRLMKISGQKPTVRAAKQSVASFKIRQGDPVGVTVTLRGARMEAFLDKLVHIALPRTKDFRGLPRTAVNKLGNMTFGIREHTIFPETSDEDIKDVFGMSITVVTTAHTRDEALAFFTHMGFPLREVDEPRKKKIRTRGGKK
jgi:large subunit ribosomal protein L5